MISWEPGESGRAAICSCRCHGIVRMNPLTGAVMAFFNVPPRYDNPMAYAEACQKCEFSHWICTTVTEQVDHTESNEAENLAVYYLNNPKRT